MREFALRSGVPTAIARIFNGSVGTGRTPFRGRASKPLAAIAAAKNRANPSGPRFAREFSGCSRRLQRWRNLESIIRAFTAWVAGGNECRRLLKMFPQLRLSAK